jgi:hypothetical protein
MLNRRGFFATLLGAVAARYAPKPHPHPVGTFGATPTVNGLAFYPKAFELVMEPLTDDTTLRELVAFQGKFALDHYKEIYDRGL